MSPKIELTFPVGCEEQVAGNLYSAFDVNKALCGFFEEAVPKAGLTLSMAISNLRILLMTGACACGIYAHFGCKFPTENMWIAIFAFLYFIQSGLVVLIDFFIVKSSCLIFIDKSSGNRVFLDIDKPKHDSSVTLRLRSPGCSVASTFDVGKFFNSNGVLEQKVTFSEFAALYRQLKDNQGKGKIE